MSPFGIWLQAARPKTLGAALAPVLMGTALAHADGHAHLGAAVAAMFGAIFIQIGTNFCNDYCDFRKGADRERIGPVRATQAGLVSPEAMLRATAATFGAAALAAIYLFFRGGWPVAAIAVASILSGIAYTAGPRPLAYVGLGDLFVLVFFGPVAVAGTYYVQALTVTNGVILAGVGPGLLAVAILVVNNLRDMVGDERAGKRTLAVRFGATFSRVQYLACVIGGCGWSGLLVAEGYVRTGAAMSSFALISAFPAIRRVLREDGAALNPALGMTAKVLVMYSLLFAAGCLV